MTMFAFCIVCTNVTLVWGNIELQAKNKVNNGGYFLVLNDDGDNQMSNLKSNSQK